MCRPLFGLFTIAGIAAAWLLSRLFPLTVPWMNAGAFTLPGFLMLLLSAHMPAKTRIGTLTTARIRGFQDFLTRAGKDRLERMKDFDLFEKMLPCAIALGVSDRWAEAFEGIALEPPGWYVSGSTLDTGFRGGGGGGW